ncbi:MAG: hypothetical protein AB7F86_04780 [Bdellovibrionales bacterium]
MTALALSLNALEFLKMTPFHWRIIQNEVPLVLRPMVRSHAVLAKLQVAAAVTLLAFPLSPAILILFFTHWFLNLRWRGVFNGGSSRMLAQILFALAFTFLAGPATAHIALIYIGIVATLSYFVAGVSKARQSRWWNGAELRSILNFYGKSIPWSPAISIGVLAWEILFPVFLILPTTSLAALSMGVLFHLINYFYFSLNRFFFAWIATYPAIYYLSVSFSTR